MVTSKLVVRAVSNRWGFGDPKGVRPRRRGHPDDRVAGFRCPICQDRDATWREESPHYELVFGVPVPVADLDMERFDVFQTPGGQSIVETAQRLGAVAGRSCRGEGGPFAEVSVFLSAGVHVRVVMTLVAFPGTDQGGERAEVRSPQRPGRGRPARSKANS